MMRNSALILLLLAFAACSTTGPAPSGGSCAEQVRQFQATSGLGVQGGTGRQSALRGAAQMYSQQAAEAAARGDETACRRYLDQARLSMNY